MRIGGSKTSRPHLTHCYIAGAEYVVVAQDLCKVEFNSVRAAVGRHFWYFRV